MLDGDLIESRRMSRLLHGSGIHLSTAYHGYFKFIVTSDYQVGRFTAVAH